MNFPIEQRPPERVLCVIQDRCRDAAAAGASFAGETLGSKREVLSIKREDAG